MPVQVDERALVDLNQPSGSYTCNGSPYCFELPSPGLLALQYTDATTYTGADPNPTLDEDDEIAFMAKDMGDRPAVFADPAGVVAGSGVEVRVTDPLDGGEGWVYLFRQAGGLDPGAGVTYVAYDFQLLSGRRRAAGRRSGSPCRGGSHRLDDAQAGSRRSGEWLLARRMRATLLPVDRTAEANRLARTYVWWQAPAVTLADPRRLLRQILKLGRPEDFVAARELWGREALRRALLEAAPGEIDPKSERFWRLHFGLADGAPPA